LKILILILVTLINLPVYAGEKTVKQIEVNSRVIQNKSIDSQKFPHTDVIEPTSIYQTSVAIDQHGKLKHKCNKTHKHTNKTVREDK